MTPAISNLLRATRPKALMASGLVHLGALVMLAQAWTTTSYDVPRLAGSRPAAIELEASFRQLPAPASVVLPARPVDVTPRAVHAFNRTFVDTPAAAVEAKMAAEVEAAVAAAHEEVIAAAALQRVDERDELIAAAQPQSIELPRAEVDPVPPVTPTRVPASLGTDVTKPPQYDHIPPPRYPELARQRGWQGTVVLAVSIDAGGHVTKVAIETSSGYQLLDAAAANAVRRWRYQPAVGRRGPVATEELQPVTFRLPR